MKMLPASFGNMVSAFDMRLPYTWSSMVLATFPAILVGPNQAFEPMPQKHALCISLDTRIPLKGRLHPIMSLASQPFVQIMQGDPTIRCGCNSHSESCIRSLGSLEMPSPVSTRFVGLQIPIYHRHQCERQTDGDIDPKVVRNADVGGILIENEQIHSEKSL